MNTDTERLDFLERCNCTVTHDMDGKVICRIDTDDKIILGRGTTRRGAIDKCMHDPEIIQKETI